MGYSIQRIVKYFSKMHNSWYVSMKKIISLKSNFNEPFKSWQVTKIDHHKFNIMVSVVFSARDIDRIGRSGNA